MAELLTLAGFGFLLGMRHATDADHVIAVATILNRSRRFVDATVIGAIWGLGHTLTVAIVGLLIIVFGIVIPPAVGLGMEFAVALMLIALGNLTGTMRRRTERFTPPAPLHGHAHEHRHAHEPGDDPHAHGHAHLHGHGSDPGLLSTFGWFQLGRPLAVGLVHGLAGSAAVALLVLTDLAINDRGQAMIYLVIFCAGVAAGMAILTTFIGLPFLVSSARSDRINRWLTIGSGVLSLAFGLYLAYQIGIVDGLFTGNFHWEPA
jgi:high-affinity nickel-transport protein